MENGIFAPKNQGSIFHNIFIFKIFQRCQKALLWSKGLKIQGNQEIAKVQIKNYERVKL